MLRRHGYAGMVAPTWLHRRGCTDMPRPQKATTALYPVGAQRPN